MDNNEDKRKDIFISYSSVNKDKADLICEKLENSGLNCWIAPRDVELTANYADEIIKGINQVDLVLLILSKDSYESIYVTEEIVSAFDLDKVILSFKIDETLPDESDKLGFCLNNTQWLDTCPNGVFEESGVKNFDDYSDKKKTEFYDTLVKKANTVCEKVRKGSYVPPKQGSEKVKFRKRTDDESFFSKYKYYIVALVIILIAVIGFVGFTAMGTNSGEESVISELAIDYVGLDSDGESYFVYGSLPSDLNDTSKYMVQTKFYDSSGKVLETEDSKFNDIDGTTLCQCLVSGGKVSKVTVDVLDGNNKVIASAESTNIISQ